MAILTPPFKSQQSIFIDNTHPVRAGLGTQMSTAPTNVGPPPSPNAGQAGSLDLILPAMYNLGSRELAVINTNISQSLADYIANQVNVTRLNNIHKHLWLAGLQRPARPLHHQRSNGREIIVTEQADLHLLWKSSRIYVKPLPEFLMCHSVWEEVICADQDLHERASGLLLSYLWLVCHRSDLNVAHELGLLPVKVTWERWTTFVRAVSETLDYKSLNGINIRYRYGELRVERINWIYGLCSNTFSLVALSRGYRHGYHNYESFIQRNLGWLISALVYVGLVLTAMQVGLATDKLRNDTGFQRASYGFTVFSIVAPLILIVGILATVLVVLVDNVRFALESRKDWSSTSATDTSKH